jgi:hypothetical protein
MIHQSHLNERGEYTPGVLDLHDETIVLDRARNEQVMRIRGFAPLPIGAEIELRDPPVSATVIGVRLLAGDARHPAALCLDVEVPASYWGEQEAEP